MIGRVVAKGRHRTVRSGTQTYTPALTRRYASQVEAEGRLAMRGSGPMTGPVRARVVAHIVPPTSWSRLRRERAVAGEIMPTPKPDLDNLLKNVFDALNGVVYRDDAQIVSKTVDKVYSWQARVTLRFEPLGAEAAYPR